MMDREEALRVVWEHIKSSIGQASWSQNQDEEELRGEALEAVYALGVMPGEIERATR